MVAYLQRIDDVWSVAMAKQKDITIEQGRTYTEVLRWEAKPIVYKAITAISNTAPVLITAVGHGIPPGWRVAVVSAKGMVQINAANTPPKDKDFHPATVVTADSIQLNDVNAADFSKYTSGGYLQYNSPVDLSGATARMEIKDKIGGNILLTLNTENGGIVIDPTGYKITIIITAVATAALTWAKGVYDLEVASATGVVTALMAGSVTVTKEVTT